MGKKDNCAVFGFNNHRLFFSLVLEIRSFTVYFSGKWLSLLHQNTAQGSFFPLQSFSTKTLRKMSRKALENTNEMCSCPLAGHPIIPLKSN